MKKSLLLLTLFLFTAASSFAEQTDTTGMSTFQSLDAFLKTVDTFIDDFPETQEKGAERLLANGFVFYQNNYINYVNDFRIQVLLNYVTKDSLSLIPLPDMIILSISFNSEKEFINTLNKYIAYYSSKYDTFVFDNSTKVCMYEFRYENTTLLIAYDDFKKIAITISNNNHLS